MSDRTYFQLTVADCPPEQARDFLNVLQSYDIATDDDHLIVGESYNQEQVSVGTAADIAAELISAAPASAFYCWEDPAYEWLGTLYRYVPDLGVFRQECDEEGLPRFSPDEVRRLLTLPDTDDDPQLNVALGVLHQRALRALIDTHGEGSLIHPAPTDDGQDFA